MKGQELIRYALVLMLIAISAIAISTVIPGCAPPEDIVIENQVRDRINTQVIFVEGKQCILATHGSSIAISCDWR